MSLFLPTGSPKNIFQNLLKPLLSSPPLVMEESRGGQEWFQKTLEEVLWRTAGYLCKVPRFLPHVWDFLAVEELREAADPVVHQAACVLSGAAQRPQEQEPLPRVAAQLENTAEPRLLLYAEFNNYLHYVHIYF